MQKKLYLCKKFTLMKRFSLLHTLLAAGCLMAGAQINSPGNDGYLMRAEAMLADKNYTGCLDQLEALAPTVLTAAQAEEAAWLRAAAQVHLDKARAVELLNAFLDTYGASSRRILARVMLGDCLLDDFPAEALAIYDATDPSLLPPDEAAALNYHTAYACLLTGDIARAGQLFTLASAENEWRAPSEFYLGYIAYLDHRYNEALALLRNADRRTLPGSMAPYYIAQIQYVEGRYTEALEAARQLLARNDAPAAYREEALRIAGESLFQLGRESEGIDCLRQYAASAAEPLHSTLYILGTAEFENGNYDAAISSLEPVSAGTPPDAMVQSAYLFIGQAMMELGNLDAALMAFDRALKMDFDREVQEAAFYNYAVARFGGAHTPFGSSVSTFEEYLTRYPNGHYAPQVQEYLVAGYLTDNNYDAALASIKRMSNPGQRVLAAKQQVLYALGTHALAAGDPQKALDCLREARELASYDPQVAAQVNLSLGEALYRTGDYKGAADRINAYLKAAPAADANRPLAYYDLGYALFAQKDYKGAARQFERFAAAPGSMTPAAIADALDRLGDTRLYTGALDGALDAYRKAYETLPDAGDYPLYQEGLIQGYRREHRAKIATMAAVMERFPSSPLVPDALLQTTEAYIQLHDNPSAIATYRRLVERFPNTAQGRAGYLQMALTQLNDGQRDEAVESYKAVVTLYPTSEEARVAVDELKRLAADDGSLPALSRWLDTVDNAPRLDVAEADALSFEAAEKAWLTGNNPARLSSYLIDYPDGQHRPQALTYLMEDASKRENVTDALAYAEEIVSRYPHSRLSEQALIVKASAEHSLGRGGDALRSYETLRERASSATTLTTALLGIMRVARDLSDQQKVIDAADALLASSLDGAEYRSEALFSRAMALDLAGRTPEARPQWQQLASQTDDLYGAKSAYYLAQSYFDSNELDKARTATEALIDSGTPHTYWLARAFILLSDIYAANGDRFEAREYLNSLRTNYPGNETDIFRMIDTRLSNL